MAAIIFILVVFALIAAIWGRNTAQGCWNVAAIVVCLVLTAAVSIAWPPALLFGLGGTAIWGFGQWAAKRNKELELQREQVDQANLSTSMARGMAELRAMRDMVEEVANAPLPPISTSAPSGSQRVITPPPISSPRSVPHQLPDRNHYCIRCGSRHDPAQRYCGDCGSALRSS
jgi:hypothetical protein